jgi:hypothetical protein
MSAHEDFEALAALDAVGAATPAELGSLEEHVETCEACRAARQEYLEVASALARSLDPVEPPESARGVIMSAVDFEEEEDPTLRQLAEARQRDTRWWFATAAMLFFALWAWRELGMRASREHIKVRDAEIASLTEENARLKHRNERQASEMAALTSGNTRVIALTGQQVAPAASARVFIESAKRRAIVYFANLPANANDKSYQLWIIRGDQAAPQSAGVFDASPTGSATIAVENLPVDTVIKAMAVTVEPRGGVPSPTNANYVVMGKT